MKELSEPPATSPLSILTTPDPSVSAYIPCYNNAATIATVIHAIRRQTRPVNELFVIDDGSTDSSVAIVESLRVRVLKHQDNLGRGVRRAQAMLQASSELVLCCDASKTIDENFVRNGLRWFSDGNVAAVFGALSQPAPSGVIDRWRGRHLFKNCNGFAKRRSPWFASYGAIVRRSSVLTVGNYDRQRRHNEDGDLGKRLISRGYEIVADPDLIITETADNSLNQLLERYWRWKSWNAGKEEQPDWASYRRWIVDSFQTMAFDDLRSLDPMSIPISLLSPHYRFWRSWWRGS